MPYLTVKILSEHDLTIVAEDHILRHEEAREKLAQIATFPGQLADDAAQLDGELWIEIETDDRGIFDVGVYFMPHAAVSALVRAGMERREAERVLSEEHIRRCKFKLDPPATFQGGQPAPIVVVEGLELFED